MKLGHVSYSKVYEFGHLVFEWHCWCGPLFLRRKDREPKAEQQRPLRDYGILNQWCRLPDKQKEQYRLT